MKTLPKVILIVCVSILWSSVFAMAADKGNFSVEPTTNNGEKWRIGYYEGGKYIEYQQTLLATIRELMELGWLETVEIPTQEDVETQGLWNWLASESQSEYLEFVADAYYTTNWTGELREQVSNEIIQRLNEKKDLNLMIAMGTWAGQDLANDKHSTPTIVTAVSDAVASGIVTSVEDSGLDHIHARVDPFRYEQQIRIFHEVIGFQKLGVAFKDTVASRSYAAIGTIERLGQELGFELVSCYITESDDLAVEEESVKQCFDELGQKADAIYVTQQKSINARTIPELVNIINSHQVPTFSQAGSEEVKNGFLLSISLAGFRYVGRFYAETIAKVLNGAKPRDLEQIFEDPPKIAINLKTAEIIGYDPPVDVLGAADEIFQEIKNPQQ